MKSLQSEGIGAAFFVTEGITMEEDILCSSGIILLTLKVFHGQCSTIVVFLSSWRSRASEFVHLTA